MIWPSTRDFTATEATVSTLPIACRRSGMDFSLTTPTSTGVTGADFLASAWAPFLSEQPHSIRHVASTAVTAAFATGIKCGSRSVIMFVSLPGDAQVPIRFVLYRPSCSDHGGLHTSHGASCHLTCAFALAG